MRKAFAHKNSKNRHFKKNLFGNNIDNKEQSDNNTFIFEPTKNNNEKDIPDWMKPETKEIENKNTRFHEEILDYVNYIIPNKESLKKCQETINLLTKIIQKNKPEWKVVLFGSYSQNIPTIFSDIDILIIYDFNKDFEMKEMYNLMNILKNEGFCDKIRLVKARVSIIKATCNITGINVDISMNRENGCHAAGVIKKIIKKYKILKPSIIILKILLQKFNLNESHSGGMNSYLLFHLIYFFFIHKFHKENIEEKNEYLPNNKISKENDSNKNNIDKQEIVNSDLNNDLKLDENNNDNNSDKNNDEYSKDDNNILINNYKEKENNITYEMNIGDFILLFLKFFGYEFDYKNNGLSLNDDNFGKIFNKNERTDIKYNNNICVESIQEKGKDVGKSCYNYEKIVNLFKAVYDKVNSEMQKNSCSILQSLGFPTI